MLALLSLNCTHADDYIIGGIGAAETCAATEGKTCSNPGLLLRGSLGTDVSRYLMAEASLDALVNSVIPRQYSHSSADKVSALTLGFSAFANWPLTPSLRVFAGPGVGVSAVRIAIHTEVFDNNSAPENNRNNNTEFGTNYGWAAGVDVGNLNNGIVRLQWQSWRSLDSKNIYDGEFNSNSLSLNYIVRY